MKTLFSIFCYALLLFPTLLFAQSTKLREIKVGYPLGGSTSYFWVAYRSGSFEKHGVKLEPVYIRGGRLGIQAALSGDMVLQLQGASTVVSAWAQGAKELQFIGAVGNRLDYILTTLPSIRKPEDLRGKKIGVNRLGGRSALIVRVMMEDAGLDFTRDLTILQLGGSGERLAALISGGIDAGPVEATLEPKLVSLGLHILRAKRAPFATAPTVVKRSYLQSHRPTMKRFMEAYLEAMQFIRHNKEDTLRTLARVLGSNDRQVLDYAYDDILGTMEPILVPPQEAVNNLLKMVAYTDKRAASVKPAGILDLSLLDELKSQAK